MANVNRQAEIVRKHKSRPGQNTEDKLPVTIRPVVTTKRTAHGVIQQHQDEGVAAVELE